MNPTPTPTPIVIHQHLAPKQSGLATAAMILGICTVVTFGATGIPALVCGILGLRECRTRNVPGDGAAITGIVLGGLTALGWAGFWGLFVLGTITSPR